MPPLAQMAHWKSLRLISGTFLWTWNARASFLPQAGTMSEVLMGMQGRSWRRPRWGILGVVWASQGSWGDKWGEKDPHQVGEKLTLGLFCKTLLKAPTPFWSGAAVLHRICETDASHRPGLISIWSLWIQSCWLLPPLALMKINTLHNIPLFCPWEENEWTSPRCCQGPVGTHRFHGSDKLRGLAFTH